jgi:AcrR family transcriptional regulator
MRISTSVSPWGAKPRKHHSKFQLKRDAVMEAAAALFRQRGYEGASLNDLADILNITKPTIYYYVESKDKLLLDIKVRVQEEILAFMKATVAGPGTALDKLRAIMIRYGEFMMSDYGTCLSLIANREINAADRVEVEGRTKEANQILYGLLDHGKREGSMAVPDRVVACHALFGSLNWMSQWAKPDGRLRPEKLIPMHVDILLSGIAAPTPRSATKPAPKRRRA